MSKDIPPIELKPCPFCGSSAIFYINDYENSDTTHLHAVMCGDVFDCGAKISDSISYYQPDYTEDVVKLCQRWNRRIHE